MPNDLNEGNDVLVQMSSEDEPALVIVGPITVQEESKFFQVNLFSILKI